MERKPEFQQLTDKRANREDSANIMIEALSSYEACCDEEMQSQEAKQREKEALLREETDRKEALLREERREEQERADRKEAQLRQEAAEKEAQLRKEAMEQALVDKQDWDGLHALRGTPAAASGEHPGPQATGTQQLQLPKFQGDMLQFSYFWSCFQSSH